MKDTEVEKLMLAQKTGSRSISNCCNDGARGISSVYGLNCIWTQLDYSQYLLIHS
jgi:hypothetical protein